MPKDPRHRVRPRFSEDWFIADSTLILPVPSLDLFVFSLLNLAFQDPGSLGLVEIRDLEDLGRVKPRIRPAAHDRYAVAHPEPRESKVKKLTILPRGNGNSEF